MICRDRMFEPMLAACPSFTSAWMDFCAEWQNEPGEMPVYVGVGDLARHLIDKFRAASTKEFPAVFHVVERWHREGDSFVREAATIGLLEGLQNVAGNTGPDPCLFEQWLQPESRNW